MNKKILPTTEEMYQMYQDGLSMLAIAEKCGCSAGTVQKRFERAGLKLRSLREAHKLAYKTGRHKVTAPRGSEHWAWKGGKERRSYRNKVQKKTCQQCGSRQNLGIHHRDMDHYNNTPENLQVLCVSCHMSLHKKAYWDAISNGEEPPKSNGPVGWERT